ncbi:helix-turn-helix domain-containing protein [Kineococcus rhizosphaerae]|uniref:AraC-like DNA-binding protein n=1 Tax=Kineococcus rhizosphaerae TaxID=559628 RepID=A0A2T0R1V0_9ACTN|nr:AraC family transcriptional regulator [Kineococcus rhizosphaerae]PRY13538.1 AraC-like DNA-binding protein [Kineococcus rhizosphaerae]
MLSDLLGATARSDVTLSYLAEPWGLRFATRSALTVHVVVRGAVRAGDGLLAAGDVLLVRGEHTITDPSGSTPGAVVEGTGRVRAAGEGPGAAGDRWRLRQPRSYGDGLSARTLVVHATYPAPDVVGRRALAGFPASVRGAVPAPLRDLLVAEAVREGPVQRAVLDRLVDLVVVTVVRDRGGPGLSGALGDPVVGPALDLLHADPAHRWTVAELAARVGVSRAALARRFAALTGSGPIGYLSEHRLDLAADLVRGGDRTLNSVARAVGYSDGFALSAAYRRRFGRPPSADRGRDSERGSETAW